MMAVWCSVVVHNDMHIQSGGNLRFDYVQEVAKFHRAIALLELRDHVAGLPGKVLTHPANRPDPVPSKRFAATRSSGGTGWGLLDGGSLKK